MNELEAGQDRPEDPGLSQFFCALVVRAVIEHKKIFVAKDTIMISQPDR